MSLKDIEKKTAAYAQQRSKLTELVAELQAEIDTASRKKMAAIRRLVQTTANKHAELVEVLEASPDLFVKPRSKTFSGVKVGFKTKRGSVVVDDQEKTIKLIREKLPEEQAELLITVKESVHKPSVSDLTAGDLKRLGIRLTGDVEEMFIKPSESAVEKTVNALLKDAEKIEDEVAA